MVVMKIKLWRVTTGLSTGKRPLPMSLWVLAQRFSRRMGH
jgi:hypothetical protein